MMVATKRLWLRRTVRAAELTSKAFSISGKIIGEAFSFIYIAFPLLFALSFLGLVAYGFGYGLVTTVRDNIEATAEDLAEAGKDACVAELLPRRQAAEKEPISLDDIRRAKRDCAEFVESQKEQVRANEQLRILREASRK